MNFNPSANKRPFGRTSRHSLKDIAEDVPFVEIDEPSKKLDKAARDNQIAKAAQEGASELMKKSPVAALHVLVMFDAGAHWADEHPESDFNNSDERMSAMYNEVTSMIERSSSSNDGNFMFKVLSLAIFTDAVSWADNNPAPAI